MRKDEGQKCPKCSAFPCAEYVLKDAEPRWRCNTCGAEGDLAGKVDIRSGYKKPSPPVKGPLPPMGGRLLFALVAGTLAIAAQADLVVTNPKDGAQLRLLGTPCSHAGTLATLKEEWRPKFKDARAYDPKGHIGSYACWYREDEDTIVVMWEDGTLMFFDPKVFHEVGA